jgi:hypothetical protein
VTLMHAVVGRCENFLHSSELPGPRIHRSASAGVGRSQKAILRLGQAGTRRNPVKDGDLRTAQATTAEPKREVLREMTKEEALDLQGDGERDSGAGLGGTVPDRRSRELGQSALRRRRDVPARWCRDGDDRGGVHLPGGDDCGIELADDKAGAAGQPLQDRPPSHTRPPRSTAGNSSAECLKTGPQYTRTRGIRRARLPELAPMLRHCGTKEVCSCGTSLLLLCW